MAFPIVSVRRLLLVALLLVLPTNTSLAYADSTNTPPAGELGPASLVRLDVEIDPLAYIFRGYSLHVGVRFAQVRLDLGAFGAAYPDFLKRNKSLAARQQGAGIKIDWRFFQQTTLAADWQEQLLRGPFAGLSSSYSWLTVSDPGSQQAVTQFRVRVSARVGWEVPLIAGFYVTPWASIGLPLNAKPVMLGGQVWDADAVSWFATLHLGFRAR